MSNSDVDFEIAPNFQHKKALFIGFILAVFLLIIFTPGFLNKAPANFPLGVEIEVPEGFSHTDIAKTLKEQGVIRSSFYFTYTLNRYHTEEFVKAGVYIFEEKKNTKDIVYALVKGESEISHMKVTFPEGFNTNDFLMYLPKDIEYTTSLNLSSLEGYLFPDTYFLTDEMSLDEIIELMQENFQSKIRTIENKITESHLSLADIITLASIVEREAGDMESKRLVSGVLHNRLEIGMALQVDAVFDYLLGKESAELTQEDLLIDSPYNTYLYPGLPPGPIANPGLDSINAVLDPEPSDYLYYLTAPDGTFHYSTTFQEHKRNKWRYLR